MSTQTLATHDEQPLAKNDIRSLLQSDRVREQIELALPKHMSSDRMMRVALTAINKNPKLLLCTQESILLALMTCSQYGIEPDGRNAHLIPYNNSKKVGDRWESTMECQFQWDYKGLVAQIRKSPEVADIYADYICKNDTYKVTRGLHRDLIHEFDIASERGPVIAFYSVCLFKDGTASFEIMTLDEVDSIRKRSKSTDRKTGVSTGAWANDYTEMGKKTVIKRHSKLLPLPTEIALALNADSDFDDIPPAKAVEIKQASVPERAALPETDSSLTATEVAAIAAATGHLEAGDIAQGIAGNVNAQPEPQPEPKPAQAREVEPEKKGPGRPAKKLEKKQEAPKDDKKAQLVARTRKELAEAGFTEGQLVQVMIANEWGKFREFDPAKTTADDFDLEILESLFEAENWDTIVAELKDLPK